MSEERERVEGEAEGSPIGSPSDEMGDSPPPEERERHGRPLGMIALMVIAAIGILAILWGRFVVNPDPEVFLFDAGPVESFKVGVPVYYPSVNIYVIALDDDGSRKELRALDGIAPDTGCSIKLDLEDERGQARNPLGRRGSFRDSSCSQAVWYLTGDALDRTSSPLRTFMITRTDPRDGPPRIEVEVIGRPDPNATEVSR